MGRCLAQDSNTNRNAVIWTKAGTITSQARQLLRHANHCVTPTTASHQPLRHANHCVTPTTASRQPLRQSNPWHMYNTRIIKFSLSWTSSMITENEMRECIYMYFTMYVCDPIVMCISYRLLQSKDIKVCEIGTNKLHLLTQFVTNRCLSHRVISFQYIIRYSST